MKIIAQIFAVVLLSALVVSCSPKQTTNKAGIDPVKFEKVVDGKQVRLETITNANGIEMTVTNFGAKVVSLMVPDKNGKFEDIVLGFDNIEAYLVAKESYFGAAIGRNGNRIANGKFTLNGEEYTLAVNNGKNHLH